MGASTLTPGPASGPRLVAASAMVGILVGSALVATRSVVGDAGPASLALLRYAIGFCCLIGPAAAGGWPRFRREDVLPIALLGIGQFGVLVALLNWSLQFISSGRAALIFATMPLLTMVFAAALGHERLTPARTVGVGATIVGVALALGDRVAGPAVAGAPSAWIGVAAAFASAGTGALCSVLYRPYLRRYPTLPVSAFAMLAAVGFLVFLAAAEGFFAGWPRFSTAGWLAVLFIGTNSGLGYFLLLWALRHGSPTRVTAFLALSPVTATALGALLLGEPVTGALLAGLACVVAGLWLAHR